MFFPPHLESLSLLALAYPANLVFRTAMRPALSLTVADFRACACIDQTHNMHAGGVRIVLRPAWTPMVLQSTRASTKAKNVGHSRLRVVALAVPGWTDVSRRIIAVNIGAVNRVSRSPPIELPTALASSWRRPYCRNRSGDWKNREEGRCELGDHEGSLAILRRLVKHAPSSATVSDARSCGARTCCARTTTGQ